MLKQVGALNVVYAGGGAVVISKGKQLSPSSTFVHSIRMRVGGLRHSHLSQGSWVGTFICKCLMKSCMDGG